MNDGEWFFYSPRYRSSLNSKKPNRRASLGYWKGTGSPKVITDGRTGVKIGEKRCLTYYQGSCPNIVKTSWLMHEFVADGRQLISRSIDHKKLDEWVFCRIFRREEAQDVLAASPSSDLNEAIALLPPENNVPGVFRREEAPDVPAASQSSNLNEAIAVLPLENNVPSVPASSESFRADFSLPAFSESFWDDLDLPTVDLSWLDDVQ
ncbi:hypothetical protein L6452_25339 [Arctium lappa]|uniref:Uncharacterized protein n=1 Tax=Arctium lappa TaxID=4217 RepID=A0ACB9AB89_ARCLA|nr:hypothetical protein L6452_25339 [Arctium lappa]